MKAMQISTRIATPDDAADVAAAHMYGWQVAYRGMVPDDYLDTMDLTRRTERWAEILAGGLTPEGVAKPADLVVEVDGRVAGFVNVGAWRGAPDDATCGEVWAMYVHPDFWGVGAGYALMQASIDYLAAQQRTTGYLWVLDRNHRARRFYERQGWIYDNAEQLEEVGRVQIREVRYTINLA